MATFHRAEQEACLEDGGSAEACDVGSGTTLFRLAVAEREGQKGCLVATDRFCVYLTSSYADAPPPKMPPDLEEAVRARLAS